MVESKTNPAEAQLHTIYSDLIKSRPQIRALELQLLFSPQRLKKTLGRNLGDYRQKARKVGEEIGDFMDFPPGICTDFGVRFSSQIGMLFLESFIQRFDGTNYRIRTAIEIANQLIAKQKIGRYLTVRRGEKVSQAFEGDRFVGPKISDYEGLEYALGEGAFSLAVAFSERKFDPVQTKRKMDFYSRLVSGYLITDPLKAPPSFSSEQA